VKVDEDSNDPMDLSKSKMSTKGLALFGGQEGALQKTPFGRLLFSN
jgi:hypothetical protein